MADARRNMRDIVILVTSLMLLSGAVVAEPAKINFLTVCCDFEGDSSTGPEITKIDRRIAALSPEVEVLSEYVSRARVWQELEKRQNVCTTRARKTDERQRIGIYSAFPHSIFPPLRLHVDQGSEFSKAFEIDLDQLVAVQGARIGVVNRRDYGGALSRLMDTYPDQFFVVSTVNQGIDVLINMIRAGRIDAFLEGTITLEDYIDRAYEIAAAEEIKSSLAHVAIAGFEANMGYYVCSRSAEGERAIEMLNDALRSRPVQEALLDAHLAWFPEAETGFLKQTFKNIFGETNHQ
ncbi:MAG: hypothetical protein HWE25_04265 [Alphaproteobacteria bacterium]|nr:hypothetical protein [Alphaproteobacteria bacterium]